MFDTAVGEISLVDIQIPTALKLAPLGTRFAITSNWYNELHFSMKTLVEVFRRIVRHFEIAKLQPNVIMTNDTDLLVLLKHRLVSLSYTHASNDLNEPLRHSLLIYTYLRMGHFQTFKLMRYMVEALGQSLVPRLSYFRVTAPDLLFWIVFIGGMASQGYSCHRWFVGNVADMAHRLGLEEWNKVRAVLGEFFYTDRSGQTLAEDLWNEVLADPAML